MSEELTVITERVDDMPLLLAEEKRMGLAQLLDEHFAPHGNWQGLSPGHTTAVWLAPLLTVIGLPAVAQSGSSRSGRRSRNMAHLNVVSFLA